MKDAIKALCAVPFLVGALLLLRLAYWICPCLREQPKAPYSEAMTMPGQPAKRDAPS